MPGKRRKATWVARPLLWGTCRDTRTGDHAVYIMARLTEPESQSGRQVRVVMSPALAREISDGLVRNSERADDWNTPTKILDRFPEA
jgi:hypothetical protein